MPAPKIHTFTSESEWKSAAADEILRDAPQDFYIALSGGSTPAPVYEKLAQKRTRWDDSHVFVVDERFVPKDHPDSNQKLINEHFDTSATYHFWDIRSSNDWQESAKQYDQSLSQVKRPIDVMILGIGPDGHTASLFPGSVATPEQDRLATTSITESFAVNKRLTMTFPTILSAKKLVILLKGKAKKPILNELLSGKKTAEEFPAKRLLQHNNVQVFYLEK